MVGMMRQEEWKSLLPKAIEDDVYEEKVKGADAVFAYANVEAAPLDKVSNVRLLRKIDLHVSPGYAFCTYCNKWIRECNLHYNP